VRERWGRRDSNSPVASRSPHTLSRVSILHAPVAAGVRVGSRRSVGCGAPATGSSGCRHTNVVTPARSSGVRLATISCVVAPGCGPARQKSLSTTLLTPGPRSSCSLCGGAGGQLRRANSCEGGGCAFVARQQCWAWELVRASATAAPQLPPRQGRARAGSVGQRTSRSARYDGIVAGSAATGCTSVAVSVERRRIRVGWRVVAPVGEGSNVRSTRLNHGSLARHARYARNCAQSCARSSSGAVALPLAVSPAPPPARAPYGSRQSR
jgi:hypothetical protein